MKIPSIVLCSAICSPLFAAGEIRHSNTNDRAEIVLGRTSNHGYAVISYLETIGDQIISLFVLGFGYFYSSMTFYLLKTVTIILRADFFRHLVFFS